MSLVGPFAVYGAVTDIHSEQKNPLGMRVKDEDGNEFIYMQGVANCVAGSWVTFDEAYVTTLATANAQGRVAVAMAAIDATTEFGWFQIYGSAQGKALTAFADNGKVYLTGTAGSVDDTDVAGDSVHGAVGRSAVDETSLLATFELTYPFVSDLAHD